MIYGMARRGLAAGAIGGAGLGGGMGMCSGMSQISGGGGSGDTSSAVAQGVVKIMTQGGLNYLSGGMGGGAGC